MKLPWLRRRTTPTLDAEQQRRRDALAAAAELTDRPLATQRFVVLDLETSGLDLRRDVVLSIGAVVIEHGAIDLGQQFECTLARPGQAMGASVLIHGIVPSQLVQGVPPADALLAFMDFLGDSPVLAFHAEFDRRMLRRALRDALAYRLRHPFLDIAELAPLLCPDRRPKRGGLDDWAAAFGLYIDQRHHASADALATAQLALILFSHARRQGIDNPLTLAQRLSAWRRKRRGALV